VLVQQERVVAALVRHPGDVLGLLEHRRQRLVRVAPLVGRGGLLAHVGQVDVAGIDGGEPGDHGWSFPEMAGRWPSNAEMARADALTSAARARSRGRTRSVGPPMAHAPATAPSRSKIGAAIPAAPTASSSRLTQSPVSRTSSSVARSAAGLVAVWA